jgi:hypothetical protein
LVFYVQKLQGHDVKALYSPSETPVDSAVVAVGNAG